MCYFIRNVKLLKLLGMVHVNVLDSLMSVLCLNISGIFIASELFEFSFQLADSSFQLPYLVLELLDIVSLLGSVNLAVSSLLVK